MTSVERHRQMDVARTHAELEVHDLWLGYVSLGGTADAFDVDGYLQGLAPLDAFQQDVLAQTLNEALEDCYRSYRLPLYSNPPEGADAYRLRGLVERLLQPLPPSDGPGLEPPGAGLG